MSQRPKQSSLLLTKVVQGYINGLKANDCDAVVDKDAGTVEVSDGDTVVFRAIHKGPDQPWIAMFYESDRIKWADPTPT